MIVYLASCLVQRDVSLGALGRFRQASQKDEEARQWQWVDRIQQATSTTALEDAMKTGEMDRFEKILAEQTRVSELQEISLCDAKGRIRYSTDPARVHQDLPSDLNEQVRTAAQPFRRRTEESFEIYRPLRAEPSCIACHPEKKPGEICGIMSLRFSTAPLKVAQQSWVAIEANFAKINVIAAAASAGTLLVTMGLLIVLGIHFGFTKPLKRLAGGLNHQAGQVGGAAGQMSGTSLAVAEGASEQASSLEETSASLEEMASLTKRNAENCQKANELARHAREAADQGVGDMQGMATAMADIKTSSDDIAKIIKTIDEIAFQTNILALNAAVEAARAGEAGMGFAVVADEVRNLAERSAQAAKETAAKIEGAIGKAAQGVNFSRKVEETLNVIVTKVRLVDELTTDVASASREQTQGIAQINSAVGQMDKVTQANAASAEECAAAAQELNSQAELMKQSVSELLCLVGGGAAAERPLPVAPRRAPTVQPAAVAEPASPPAGIIGWDEAKMTTGVHSIDEQHQELIRRINDLHAACLLGTAREELMEQLDFLGKYATNHFAHEEGVMNEHRCPLRGQNKAAHVKFLHDYQRLVELVNKNGASTKVAIELKKMLADWLTGHICRIDTSLRSCGNGQSPAAAARRNEIPLEGDFKDF